MSNNESILWTKAVLRTLLGLAVVCVVGFVGAKGAIAQEVVAIAAGGPAQSNSGGGDYPFVADEDFSGGGDNRSVAATINLTQPGANAAPMAVYQHAQAGVFTYTIPGLTAGTQYSVLLHFAETYFNAAGQREFDVAINGTSSYEPGHLRYCRRQCSPGENLHRHCEQQRGYRDCLQRRRGEPAGGERY